MIAKLAAFVEELLKYNRNIEQYTMLENPR